MVKIPRSVAIIMDGNGRWAQSRGLERFEGHIKGVEAVRQTIKTAVARGVEYLTLYAFSTENWGRPDSEVEALMELFGKCMTAEVPELKERGVKMCFIGDRRKFTPQMQQKMAEAEAETAMGERLTLQVALNYSSRDEIRRAFVTLAEAVKEGRMELGDVDESAISGALDTASTPDPDLVIRTSGECRLSNFMMWQASYSEFYFPEVLWPDFDEAEFDRAIEEYTRRDRRFGLVNE